MYGLEEKMADVVGSFYAYNMTRNRSNVLHAGTPALLEDNGSFQFTQPQILHFYFSIMAT